jgi:hypothetical protein
MVPKLRPTDILKFKIGDGKRRCLFGWLWIAFSDKPNLMYEGLKALEDSIGCDHLTEWNDQNNPITIARAWNQARGKLQEIHDGHDKL